MKTVRASKSSGYTLTELMITVAIIGILAVIAIPTYFSYHRKAKTAEAANFLATIKGAQEAYRADHQVYCQVSPSQDSWNPQAPTITDSTRAWRPAQDNWDTLGVSPGAQSLFSYSSVAGPAGTTPSSVGFSDDRGYTATQPWFISSAIGDLDQDGIMVTFESYSESSGLYISEAAGWE